MRQEKVWRRVVRRCLRPSRIAVIYVWQIWARRGESNVCRVGIEWFEIQIWNFEFTKEIDATKYRRRGEAIIWLIVALRTAYILSRHLNRSIDSLRHHDWQHFRTSLARLYGNEWIANVKLSLELKSPSSFDSLKHNHASCAVTRFVTQCRENRSKQCSFIACLRCQNPSFSRELWRLWKRPNLSPTLLPSNSNPKP